MQYSAAKLINNAYYLSGVVARGFQTVSGTQMSDAFDLLQDILADKNINSALIPFYKSYSTNAVVDQEMYFVPGLIIDETLTFNIGNIRFPVIESSRKEYFGSGRVAFDSIIIQWHAERALNGSNIYLYPFPNTTYPINIFGKFALDALVTPDDDLSLIYEYAYIDYMKYKLGQRICSMNNVSMSPEARQELKDFEEQLTGSNAIDLRVQITSTLDGQHSPSWAFFNLFNGYTP